MAPSPPGATTVALLRREPQQLRAVVALACFSIAEHAAWVTFLVVAFERGGVREAGIVSAALLLPAAVIAPLLAKEVSGRLRLGRPLAAGYAVQFAALVVATSVAATDADPVLFYMAAALVTMATVFSRPVHHAVIAGASPEVKVAANVATGFASGLAQLVGPLAASLLLIGFSEVAVLGLATVLLAAATVATLDIRVPGTGAAERVDTATWPPRRPALRDALRRDGGGGVSAMLIVFSVLGLMTVVLGVVETLAAQRGNGLIGEGGAGTGALIAGAGGGLLAGASLAGVMLRRWSERATMRLGTLVTGAALVLCTRSGGPVWSIAAFVTVGAGMQTVLVAGWVRLHRHIRPSHACLVFGLLESQQLVGNAAGSAGAGLAISMAGPWVIVVASVVVLSVATALLGRPVPPQSAVVSPVHPTGA
jgi:predicted MFS family arabinose efflux permease